MLLVWEHFGEFPKLLGPPRTISGKGKLQILLHNLCMCDCSFASQIQPTPVRIAFSIMHGDTESDPRKGWLGLACETSVFDGISTLTNEYVAT